MILPVNSAEVAFRLPTESTINLLLILIDPAVIEPRLADNELKVFTLIFSAVIELV